MQRLYATTTVDFYGNIDATFSAYETLHVVKDLL